MANLISREKSRLRVLLQDHDEAGLLPFRVSPGTTKPGDPAAYEATARVPFPIWSPLGLDEFHKLVDVDRNWDHGRSLFCGKINDLDLAKIRSTEPGLLGLELNDPNYRKFVVNVVQILRHYVTLSGRIHYLGISKDPVGAITVSVQRLSGLRVGLHVDDWDKLELDKRGYGLNRISINVGMSQRSFLFIPVQVSDLRNILEDAGHTVVDSGRIASQFMEIIPDIPVLRYTLDPGSFYIAPTENLIHDGSTSDTGEGSICLNLRGIITPLCVRSVLQDQLAGTVNAGDWVPSPPR